MARWDTEWWVWYERPGYPHLAAAEYGGRSFMTFGAAMAEVKRRVKDGSIVRVYQCERTKRAAIAEEGQ